MYAQVIVPLDGGDAAARALIPGLRLAAASDGPLRGVGVAAGDVQIPGLQLVIEGQVEAAVAAEGSRVQTSVVVKHQGEPWRAIVEELAARPGSLICMASRGRTKASVFLGSTGEAVLRAVTTPVFLVGPAVDAERFELARPVLVCVDGSHTSESILPIAASWSIAFHVDLTVATVVARSSRPANGGPDHVDSSYVRRIAEKLSADTGRTVDFDVLHSDDPAGALVAYANDRDVCAVAAATHGHTGLRRVTAGSVTAALIRRAAQPVLTYRPLELLR
jgi:nucleotide-binding universal stress UspA family protein